MTAPDDTLRRAFWDRVEVADPCACWHWTGHVNTSHGYGELSFGPRGKFVRWRAHRLSYVLNKGPIPDGLVIMHSCDNRRCVNPDHLSAATQIENNLDCIAKGRAATPPSTAGKRYEKCRRGHPLTDDNILKKPGGGRRCKTCNREGRRKNRAEKRLKEQPFSNGGGNVE